MLTIIQNTPAVLIPELDLVKEKYIQNYNACNKEKNGELMYHRNVIHMKQAIANVPGLIECDPFSLYACFATAAVNGYSLDPGDDEVYLIPRGGKAYLQKQAGAHIRRLIRTGQIAHAEQAKLVYQGDEFEVVNGRVTTHKEKFLTDVIVAGYIRMVLDLDTGRDIYFIYRKSDWESWRRKSPMKNGENWNTNNQPLPGFLRTKITLHAAKEKCWATGNTPAHIETFTAVEVEADDEGTESTVDKNSPLYLPKNGNGNGNGNGHAAAAKALPVTPVATQQIPADDSFNEAPAAATKSVTRDDDEF
jgi:recombinational DNA repair protein RecT